MKKILLLGAAVLMAVSVNAQLLRTVQPSMANKIKNRPHRIVSSHELTAEDLQMTQREMRDQVNTTRKAPKRDNSNLEPCYIRPAGAYSMVFMYDEEEESIMQFYASFFAFKPYATYTFDGFALGSDANTNYHWDVFYEKDVDAEGYPIYDMAMIDYQEDLEWSWGYEYGDMPIFYAENDPDADWPQFQFGGWTMGGDYANPVKGDFHTSMYASASDYDRFFGGIPYWSSKDFSNGGRNGDQYYNSMPITGLDPYNPVNDYGWWFGKNGGSVTNDEGVKRIIRIDGVAQAFEKPTHPYVLNQVVMLTYAYYLNVTAPVELECKVYKLDEIPAYSEDENVYMRESDFGELVATGRTIVTPATKTEDMGAFYFTLYGEEDGIEVEVTPTIDFPILVVFEDYNKPDKSNLVDFTLEAATDDLTDEGYGELAYIKYGLNDDDGNFSGQYIWCGINNFFTSGTMKTGLTIFLDIANPFLTFYYDDDAEYTFPAEGGLMQKTIEYPDGQSYTTTSIEFFSWVESADDGWMLSTPDGKDVPDWLHITLTDKYYTSGAHAGEFNNCVNAVVEADPLPEGMKGRKAVVRFGFPGAFLDYTFIQGEVGGLKGDVNGDGEVNIADVNTLVDIILGGVADDETKARADVNEDAEINIADINALIDIILGA